jgi:hypothetical protein
MAEATFPCPACGFLTFWGGPGSYEICGVCGWENDHVQLAHPRFRGGANHESLVEAQLEAIKRFPLERRSFVNHQRDPEWRPVTDEEAAIREGAPHSGSEYAQAAGQDHPRYYWCKDR